MQKKTVVITGGNSGIGFACANYLSQNNYKVIITGRDSSKINRALAEFNGDVEGYVVEASDLHQIDTWVATLQSKGYKIDGLFINAGIFISRSFDSTTSEIFDQTMNVNFKGPYFTVQKMLSILNNPCSIVLNTSIVVFKAFSNTSVYTASKAALESLAQVLNVELAAKGIRVNIISPGLTKTPILEKAGLSKEEVDALMSSLEMSLPIGRPVLPSDIAPILHFLLSDASQVLRNEKIIVDGGSTL